MAAKVFDLEVSERIGPVWDTEHYDYLYILARYHGQPLGWLVVENERRRSMVSAERIREALAEQMVETLALAVLKEELSPPPATENAEVPPISVIICTRDRADQLAGCLGSVLALDHPCYEVIVVDNAPGNDQTAQLARDMSVRYVCEKRPGLDWARNRGLAEATYEIVAFTDDDARPDRGWLRAISQAFAESDAMCVTGFIGPAELETEAQEAFEFAYGGMGKGFRRRTFRAGGLSKRDLLWANTFGVGANMAFRQELFRRLGPFDVALDAGTPAGGAGDLEMFHRLIANGYVLVYEPTAIVWHRHRRSPGQLRRQLYDNGRGFGSYVLTCIRRGTVTVRSGVKFVVLEWWGRWLVGRLLRPRSLPRRFVLCELCGALRSPLAYRAAQVRSRRIAVTEAD
jgi:cellulose synthase/poly-beta-1,6-N-acetylglucosamine synthase-like glycosyltransferase